MESYCDHIEIALIAVDAAQVYPWLPVRPFMLDPFDSVSRAAGLPLDLPVVHFHGTLDAIAPLGLGKKLFAALPVTPKRFVEHAGVGHFVLASNPTRLLAEAAAFLDEHLDGGRVKPRPGGPVR